MHKFSDIIKKFNIVHNNYYDYSKSLYKSPRQPIEIICPIHGSFYQRPDTHWKGGICTKCSYILRGKNLKYNKDEFIKESNIKHNNKYDYSKFEYADCHTKSIIICPIHGEFLQSAKHHIGGSECQMCARLKANKIQRVKTKLPLNEFIIKANKLHNNYYDYSLVHNYNNIREKLKIICPIHGLFEQQGHNHLSGNGCKKCGQYKTRNSERSANETELYNELFKYNNKIVHNDRDILEGYELDIVNYETKRAIEFNGDYWHCNPIKYDAEYEIKQLGLKAKEIWSHDKMKIDFAKRKGYKIMTIWESEFLKNKNEIINKCINFLKD